MSLCRTCLATPADKQIPELEKDINEDNKNYFDIMVFCLDIKIIQNSKITMHLCNNCYDKILVFYKFKAQSLENDTYLKSLEPVPHQEDQKPFVHIKEDKVDNNLLQPDTYNPGLVKNCIKVEMPVKEENVFEDEENNREDGEISEGFVKDDSDDESSEDETSDEKPPVKHKTVWDRFKKNAPKRKITKKGKRTKNLVQGRQVCEECGTSVMDLPAHLLTHQPKDKRAMLQCKACPKKFMSRGGLRRHYKIRHLGIKATCDICNKEVVHLGIHKMQVHDRASLPFGCSMCPRRYVSKPALETHMTSHTLEAAFTCEICSKKFRTKKVLTTHIRQVHEKEKNYHCELCSKAFFWKSWLEDHMRTHTKERPYQCSECGSAFMTKVSLRNHRIKHSDVRRFKCEFCDMTFKQASSLKTHMITHAKEKAYSCQYCGKRFGRVDSCRRHEATRHNHAKD